MNQKQKFGVAVIVLLVLLAISFQRIFCDPYHEETRGFTFWEWLEREIEELRTGER